MNNFKKIILIFICFLISFIFGLPHILIPRLLKGKQYSPLVANSQVPTIPFEETEIYAAKTREVLNGSLFLHEIATAEYQNFPSPFIGESLPAQLMAFLTLVSGSVSNGFILADFLFPPLTFLLFFYLTYKVTKNFYLSLITGPLTLFAFDFIAYLPYPVKMFNYFFKEDLGKDFLFFSRSFPPQVTFLILLTSLIFLYKALREKEQKWTILAGILAGLNFYTYFYNWTFYFLGILFLGMFFLVKKGSLHLKKVFVVSLIACLIGSYYFYNLALFKNTIEGENFLLKYSLPPVSRIDLATLRYLFFALIFAFFYKIKRRRQIKVLILSFILSGFFLINFSQKFFGRDFVSFHWARRALMPWMNFSIIIFVDYLLHKFHRSMSFWSPAICGTIESSGSDDKLSLIKCRYLTLFSFCFLGLLFYRGFSTQYQVSLKYYQAFVLPKDERQLLEWLNKNTKKKSTIATLSQELNHLIPTFTHDKVFIPKATNTLMTTEKAKAHYLFFAKFLKVSLDYISSVFNDPHFIWYIFFLDNKETELFKLDEEKKEKTFQEYKILSDEIASKKIMREVDYLLIGEQEERAKGVDLEEISFLRKVFTNDSFEVYQVVF